MKNRTSQLTYLEISVLLLISALAYLLFASRLGYYKDDWYLMYSAHTQGASIFKDIFAIDRPARGVLLSSLYIIYGDHALYYNISSYFFRVLSAVGFLWGLRLLWPSQQNAGFLMALLFLLYPGYLSQVNAIDYQSYTVSLCCVMLSMALSFQMVLLQNKISQAVLGIASILLGWWYLALVEYFIGFEVLRFLGLFLLAMKMEKTSLLLAIKRFIRHALAFLSIPAVFLFWRVVIFQNERKATDVAAQLGNAIISPGLTSVSWLFSVVRDTINVIFLGWVIPLYNSAFQAHLREIFIGSALAGLAVLILLMASRRIIEEDYPVEAKRWSSEAFWVGLFSAVAGIIPIIVANRHVDFSEFSRYALPGAAGGVIVLVSIIYHLPERTQRIRVASSLVFVAVLVHYVGGANAVRETAAVNEFWWQVSWRAPQISKGTTLIVKYAAGGIPEDYVVWGPANLIYYPEVHSERPVNTDLYAALLTNETISNLLIGFGNDSELGRGTISFRDYKKVLVLTQPHPSSCMRILDGQLAEISIADNPGIMLIAPYSDIENILPNETPRIPPQAIFGMEPGHDEWCFYYQKASLARQQGDWIAIAQLEKEAAKRGLHPYDQVEWMPFLQAAAMLGDMKEVKQISTRVNVERFYKQQACRNLKAMEELNEEMQGYISELFCN